MNRGIETAFWGTLGKDPELKTSKTGNPFATMNVVVTVGTSDDGKDVSQWIRCACFGATATAIAAKASKGDRVYIEGTLTLNTWTDKSTGEAKTGLSVAAWKAERVASIGKSRERKPGAYQSDGEGQHRQNGRQKHHDFDDAIPFEDQFR